MYADPFKDSANSLIGPSSDCFTISPSDTQDLNKATKAIYVGSGGDVVVRPIGSGSDVTFRNVIGGSILDVRVRAVRETGTTAFDIVGMA